MGKVTKLVYKTFEKTSDLKAYGKAQIAKAISARAGLQKALYAFEEHYLMHGNRTPLCDFLEECDGVKGINIKGMIIHVEKFTGLTRTPIVNPVSGTEQAPKSFNGHSGWHKGGKNALSAQELEETLKNARELMWWDTVKQNSAFQPTSAEAILVNALKMERSKRKAAEEYALENGIDMATIYDTTISPALTKQISALIGLDAALIDVAA